MSQPILNKPVRVPAHLIVDTRTFWNNFRANTAKMESLVAAMEALKAEQVVICNTYRDKLVEEKIVEPGQEYNIDTRYLDALGFAYIWVEGDKPNAKRDMN